MSKICGGADTCCWEETEDPAEATEDQGKGANPNNIIYTVYYIYIYYDMLLWNGATHPAWSVNLRYDRMPVVKSEEHWARAFHGTWWYSVWLVLESGVFLESNDRDKGRDDQGPGLAGYQWYQWHGQQISRKSGSPTFCWMRSPISCCINPPYFVSDKLIHRIG